MSQYCSNEENYWRYLTEQPSSCSNCSNYISCEICASNDYCEWGVEEAKCSKRGSGSNAIQNVDQCPIPCHLRSSCSQCVEEKGRCVWCESTKVEIWNCFL